MNITIPNRRSVAINPLGIIDRIIAELELTKAQYEEVKISYESVGNVLVKIHPQWRPNVFPQGSMRLGTTIRPHKGERFDLDMICWVAISGKHYTPEQVYNLVWDALGQDPTYRNMRRKKNRCIRIEYAADKKYYLDVTPAVPDWALSEALYVPDREHQKWCSSHPIGFCDDWFKKRSEVLPIIRTEFSTKERSVMMANAIEPMPEYGEFEKTPLQRIAQMLKRDRDEYFENDPTHRPSSILLTTIITHSYSDSVCNPVNDLLDFVVNVVMKIPNFISVINVQGKPTYLVMNPVNPGENFAEHWTEEHYKRFRFWHKSVGDKLQTLQQCKGKGGDVLLNRLSETFGKERVVRAASSLGADTSALHESGKLRVERGAVGIVGAAIPKTIYFGSAK